MTGAGDDVNASDAVSTYVDCIAGKAGGDGDVSKAPVCSDGCWTSARRRRWFDGSGELPTFQIPGCTQIGPLNWAPLELLCLP